MHSPINPFFFSILLKPFLNMSMVSFTSLTLGTIWMLSMRLRVYMAERRGSDAGLGGGKRVAGEEE
jgi:hypothetical protein